MKPAKTGGMRLAVHLVVVFAMIFVRPHAVPKLFGVCGHHAALTRCSHDLVLTEGKRRDISERANASSFVGGSMGLRTIFHYLQIALSGEFQNGIHFARPSGKMDSDDGLG